MKNVFEYKGYLGSAEIDTEGMALVGKLLFIRDVVAYSADSLQGLDAAFREAVDDYLGTCEQLGEEPDTPCKGTFNVRIGPELHRQVALVARAKGLGLNEFVVHALASAADAGLNRTIEHVHRVEVAADVTTARRIGTPGQVTKWENLGDTRH